MNLQELNNLNFKDIPNWPWIPKAGVLVVLFGMILFAGYWFDSKDQLASLEASKRKEAELRETFLGKKKQAVNLATYKQQLKDIEQSFGALLKQLPNKAEMDALLIDINQAGLGRGLEFELFRPAASESKGEFYAELPITIRVTGSYHDLGAFASDIAQLPRIVTLNNLAISPGAAQAQQPTSVKLVMDAVAKTYRYLDDNEMAAVKKPEPSTATPPKAGGDKGEEKGHKK